MKFKKHKFIFRGKERYYDYNWIDKDTFTFCFGDGEFVDKDGDKYFILVEYHENENAFIFEIWYEYQVIPADENYLTDLEKSKIINFMSNLVNNVFVSMLAIV